MAALPPRRLRRSALFCFLTSVEACERCSRASTAGSHGSCDWPHRRLRLSARAPAWRAQKNPKSSRSAGCGQNAALQKQPIYAVVLQGGNRGINARPTRPGNPGHSHTPLTHTQTCSCRVWEAFGSRQTRPNRQQRSQQHKKIKKKSRSYRSSGGGRVAR